MAVRCGLSGGPMAASPSVATQSSIATARSVPEMLLARVAATPNGEAYQIASGSEWKSITWKEYAERVQAIACGLRALGMADEQRAAILSGTRLEWLIADLGILGAGGATTT